ncbi:MAG: nuclear transport factor 2 family protein [Actinomycetota bacterium]|nr:nuclear transport factor 2 family protein [Actinomycetota bacterium]
MSEEERNLAIAREGLEAFQRGDIEAFLNLLDPDVEIYSPPDLANPAQFRGRDGWLRWASRWLDAWETFELEAEGFEPVGEHHVLMKTRQHGIGKGSGVEVEMRVYYMLEYHDGLATRVHLYADREQALEEARAGEQGAPGAP